MRTLQFLSLLVVGSAIGLACGDESDEPTISVNLTNFAIEPSASVLSAGTIMVEAVHADNHSHGDDEGGATHQLLIARLEDGAADGNAEFGPIVLNLEDIAVGETRTGEVELEPGTYELACLVVEEVNGESVDHYALGMHTTIRVE